MKGVLKYLKIIYIVTSYITQYILKSMARTLIIHIEGEWSFYNFNLPKLLSDVKVSFSKTDGRTNVRKVRAL